MDKELNNDVENILFYIKNNIIPDQLNELFQQIQPLINELVKQAYKEGFEQGKEFATTQPNGFN